jgi:ADP-ribosylglycohydrolase
MRAAIVGVAFAHDEARRRDFGRAIAQITHTDPRAVDGALFAAELAAACCYASPDADRAALVEAARRVVTEPSLAAAIARATALAVSDADPAEASRTLGTTGFVMHTIPLATYAFVRFGDRPLNAIQRTITAGGDTDTNAAIVGAWVGTLHGPGALPPALVAQLHDGPFGPTHLRRLARAMGDVAEGRATATVRYSALAALARNVALFPVVFLHAVRVLVS